MYITRFAHRLDFGEKTHDVAVTALRLVSRMKRDWLHTGRRPSGLCGAALLVAARFHGFNCELSDVVKVVKIGQDTIRKRLTEFESTPSSQLTINEFMNIDLEAEHDPPAFYSGRLKSKMQQMEAEAGGMGNIENQIGLLSSAIDDKLSRDRPDSPVEKKATPDTMNNTPIIHDEHETDPDLKVASDFVHSENPQDVAATLLSPRRPSSSIKSHTARAVGPMGPAPTMESLGLDRSVAECFETPVRSGGKRKSSQEGELDMTGINDDEIDKLLLTPHESEIKSKIWNQEFGEFVLEMEEKRRKKNEEQKKKPRAFKGTRKKRKEYYSESKTAGEAIEKLFSRQKLSNKIDYEALRKATEVKQTKSDVTLPEEPFVHPTLIELTELEPAKPKKARVTEACLNPEANVTEEVVTIEEEGALEEQKPIVEEEEEEEEEEEDEQEDLEETSCVSASLLMQKAGMAGEQDFGYGGYEGDDYY